MRKIILMLLLGLFALGLWADPSLAQGKYPSKAIDIIVPYSPGGGTDIMFRNIEKIISQHKLVPQPINIVNRGGEEGRSGKPSASPGQRTAIPLPASI